IFSIVTLRPRASRSAPSDAAASPFPSEETTPPVTKMNLVFPRSTMMTSSPLPPRRRRLSPGPGKVLSSIYLKRWRHGRHHPDCVTIFERAELFEFFDSLQHPLRQGREPQQELAPIGVYADVPQRDGGNCFRVARIRNRRARKIQ